MRTHTATPPSFVIFALAGGLLFILGGVITAMSPNSRMILTASAMVFTLLGIYAVIVVIKHNRLVAALDQLEAELAAARSEDAGLRVRLGYTLREPLTTVVGLAEGLLSEPGMPTDARMATITEIRNNVREVEQVLGDLSAEERFTAKRPNTDGVVLLHEEVRSITSTLTRSAAFSVDLRPARAWGDSAAVRQVLRTVIAAAASSACTSIELVTEQRKRHATVTLSGRGDLLDHASAGALTGTADPADELDDGNLALREAHDIAVAIGGTIGFAEALGRSHIVIEFEATEDTFGLRTPSPITPPPAITAPRADPKNTNLTFAATMELRPERPTAGIRFN